MVILRVMIIFRHPMTRVGYLSCIIDNFKITRTIIYPDIHSSILNWILEFS